MWIEPYTDWNNGTYCSPSSINRIMGNMNYLVGRTVCKDDFTSEDIITVQQFEPLLFWLKQLSYLTGVMYSTTPDYSLTAENFNLIETIEKRLKPYMDIRHNQNRNNHFVGYNSLNQIYLGGN